MLFGFFGIVVGGLVGLVLEGLRLDDEALDSRRAGGGWKEFELERGQGPVSGI